MPDNVVNFPKPPAPNKGNGAREVLTAYFKSGEWSAVMVSGDLSVADHLLGWLWEQGYRVERHEENA